MHLHQVMKKTLVVLYSFLLTDEQKKGTSPEREESVKLFHNKLGTTDARFLSYNGISLLSQQASGHCIVLRTAEYTTYPRRDFPTPPH